MCTFFKQLSKITVGHVNYFNLKEYIQCVVVLEIVILLAKFDRLKLKMYYFLLIVKDGYDNSDKDVTKEITSSPWSRGMIVGLCAGMTLVIILVVGLALLCRYSLRQRKLKMEFEDDVEVYRSISR